MDVLGRLDRRLLYLAALLCAVVAVLWPPALPVHPRPETRSAFRLAQTLQPGQAVFIWIDYGFGGEAELNPMLSAVLLQLMRRRAVICIASRTLEGGQIADSVLRKAAAGQPAYLHGYGTTWIDLGYRPAPDLVLRAATINLPAAENGVDENGTPLPQLPVAARLRALTPAHFRLAYVFDLGDGYAAMMTYVSQVTGLPMIVGAISMEAPVILPFVATGQIAAIIPGIRGAAEYETLLPAPGAATALDRGDALIAVFMLLVLALGNLGGAWRSQL